MVAIDMWSLFGGGLLFRFSVCYLKFGFQLQATFIRRVISFFDLAKKKFFVGNFFLGKKGCGRKGKNRLEFSVSETFKWEVVSLPVQVKS